VSWNVVLDVSGGPTVNPKVIAAAPIFAHPRSRWCSTHTAFDVGDDPVAMVKLQAVSYQTSLTAPLSASDTILQVSGDPLNSASGDSLAHLLDAAVGDYFQIQDGFREVVQIQQKLSPTSWLVSRAFPGVWWNQMNTSPVNHSAGVSLTPTCKAFFDN